MQIVARWTLPIALLATACNQREDAAPPPPSSVDLRPWARGAADAGAIAVDAGLAPPSSADPSALEELLAAAPKTTPRPTGEDGGTAIGVDTGLPVDSASPQADKPGEPPHKPNVAIGPLSLQGEMSSAAVEKAARAELYYRLVTRCRDKQNKILPADSIHMKFSIDTDGYIVAPTIIVTPSYPRYDDAANCMRRELSTATFRAPAAARGLATSVDMTVPSID